ncbi:acyl dehydratase [Nocardioides stalactiti]|uniref:acyl dehydratase n=1 Tax=Nocardioides stalactiti TaxID=2755356 RepID=UPI0016026008|nr:acyl dehydratase [Nocardioides stalactiti]
MSAVEVGGPFFDDLEVGRVFDTAPGCTLTEGRAAQHQSIVGDRWRLALDDDLARRVAGGAVAAPSLVWNVAIGQSTLATQRVRANLFYRRLALLRQPAIGDTLRTTTTVVGLKENSRREGRPATGLAALHMVTSDQEGRSVLDFYRCAMLPVRGGPTGRADDLDAIGAGTGGTDLLPVPDWDRDAYVAGGTPVDLPSDGTVLEVASGDVVSNAPELARLTLNIAAAHHDRHVSGQRLVYGGHTIAVAAAQLCRALPGLATVLAWDSCDHVGPVHEGDTLTSRFTVERVAGAGDWRTVELRAEVLADRERPVLDWRFTALAP